MYIGKPLRFRLKNPHTVSSSLSEFKLIKYIISLFLKGFKSQCSLKLGSYLNSFAIYICYYSLYPEKPEDVILFFTYNISRGVTRNGITKQPEADSACKCVNIFLRKCTHD